MSASDTLPRRTPRERPEIGHRHTSGLPDDLLESARHRLGWACLIYAAAYFSAYWLPKLTGIARNPMRLDLTFEHTVSIVSIALSLALWLALRLEELMGQGGMGEVWRARHRLLARPAAVKLIRRHTADGPLATTSDRVLRRFEREAQATAQLQCPHSIQLYDFGLTRDGSFFYVMELLNGLDLETLVERFGPQPAERTVHLVRQACQSLEEAHLRGLLHRDIKPANIFCCRYGLELDFVKVLDFGLVKTYGDSDAVGATKLTAEGTVTGTPAFMAPEALMGDTADARTDLYALGCVAYSLLTGRMVFDAPSPMKLALMHVERLPTAPSQVTELPIPPALDRLVLDLLAKRPEDRPASASQLMARLDDLVLDAAWTQERARAWWHLHLPDRITKPAPLALGSGDPLTPVL